MKITAIILLLVLAGVVLAGEFPVTLFEQEGKTYVVVHSQDREADYAEVELFYYYTTSGVMTYTGDLAQLLLRKSIGGSVFPGAHMLLGEVSLPSASVVKKRVTFYKKVRSEESK